MEEISKDTIQIYFLFLWDWALAGNLKTTGIIPKNAYYVVAPAINEKEAEFPVRTKHIDLLVFDLNLGIDDGVSLSYDIYRINPKIKTILMTGGDINISEKDIKKLGIDKFIKKPFDIGSIKKGF
ncbi:MAG: response regulator [Elusimicrobiota bacterium]